MLSQLHSQWQRVRGIPAVARSVQAIITLAAGLRTEPISLRAAALTYLSVLAVVPLLTVVLSFSQVLLGKHAMESHIRDFVVQNLAVGAQESVAPYITQFVQRASKIGSVGFLFLVFSSISLMANIEAAFNHIYRVSRPRPIVVRFGIYWCILTLGPLLLALSFASTALLENKQSDFQALHYVFVIGPFLLAYAAFTVLYLIVPNATVRFRPAFLGAFIAGTTWEIAKVVYAEVSSRSVRNDAIYGSLSAIPVFLAWTYLSWIIVLFGARVAYAAQTAHPEGAAEPARTPLDRELLTVRTMRAIASAFDRGAAAPDVDHLALTLPAVPADIQEALDRLYAAGLARETDANWLPARALRTITLAEVRAAARSRESTQGAHDPDLAQAWARADAAAGRELTLSLEELVRGK